MANTIHMLIALAILSSNTFWQEKSRAGWLDLLSTRRVELGYEAVSVIYADSLNAFPDSAHIEGTIVGITSVPAPCGVFCWWGTALIHLDKRPGSLFGDSIYIAVMCLYGKEMDFVARHVSATVVKLFERDLFRSCNAIFNKFDSRGIPFYKLTDNSQSPFDLR